MTLRSRLMKKQRSDARSVPASTVLMKIQHNERERVMWLWWTTPVFYCVYMNLIG